MQLAQPGSQYSVPSWNFDLFCRFKSSVSCELFVMKGNSVVYFCLSILFAGKFACFALQLLPSDFSLLQFLPWYVLVRPYALQGRKMTSQTWMRVRATSVSICSKPQTGYACLFSAFNGHHLFRMPTTASSRNKPRSIAASACSFVQYI